jgi:hypothetical protein
VMNSSVQFDGKRSTFTYAIKNAGNAPVSVVADLPITLPMRKDIPIVEKPEVLMPGIWKSFRTTAEGAFRPRSATLTVYDKSGKSEIGTDIAGVYSPIDGRSLHAEYSFEQ